MSEDGEQMNRPMLAKLERGGQVKEVPLDKLKKPHAVSHAPGFKAVFHEEHSIDHETERFSSRRPEQQHSHQSNAGGLLQTGGHRPTVNTPNRSSLQPERKSSERRY